MKEEKQLLRLDDVKELTGLSASSIYRMTKENDFPAPTPLLGRRIMVWNREAVDQWVSNVFASEDSRKSDLNTTEAFSAEP